MKTDYEQKYYQLKQVYSELIADVVDRRLNTKPSDERLFERDALRHEVEALKAQKEELLKQVLRVSEIEAAPPVQIIGVSGRTVEVFRFIQKYVIENGYSPMQSEIAGGIDPPVNKSGIQYHLDKLQEVGLIKRKYRVNRSIEITGQINGGTR